MTIDTELTANVIPFARAEDPRQAQARERREIRQRKAAVIREINRIVDRADRRRMAERIGALLDELKQRKDLPSLKAVAGRALDKSCNPVRDLNRFRLSERSSDAPLHARFASWVRLSDELARALGHDPDDALLELVDGTSLTGDKLQHLERFAELRDLLGRIERAILARHDLAGAFAYLLDNEWLIEAGPRLVPPDGWYQRFAAIDCVADEWSSPFFTVLNELPGISLPAASKPISLCDYLPAIHLTDIEVTAFALDRGELQGLPALSNWFESYEEIEARQLIATSDCIVRVHNRLSLTFLPIEGGPPRLCVVEDPYLHADERAGVREIHSGTAEQWDDICELLITAAAVPGHYSSDRSDAAVIARAAVEGSIRFRRASSATVAEIFGQAVLVHGDEAMTINTSFWDETNNEGTLRPDGCELPTPSPRSSLAAALERNLVFADSAGEGEQRIDRLLDAAVGRWVAAVEAQRADRKVSFDGAMKTLLDEWASNEETLDA